MTSAAHILLVSSVAMAVVGFATFVLARHSVQTSRGILMAIFSHGAFATGGLLFAVTLLRIRSLWPPVVGLEDIGVAIDVDFDCDLTLSCVAVAAVVAAGIVLLASAFVSQLSSRALVRRCTGRRASGLPPGIPVDVLPPGTGLWVLRDPVPDAFALAVVRFPWGHIPWVEDVVVITQGLVDLLSPEELRAALAHEAAHVRARDNRYLPFVNTLATLLFLDPILRILSRRLAARYEFGADEDTARATRDPRSLARAILKVYDHAIPARGTLNFLGPPGVSPAVRIQRLLDLAELWEGMGPLG